MMMTVEENEEEEEQAKSDEHEDNTDERLKELEEKEKLETYEYLQRLVVETADNVVKTAMTGKILFALRFNDDERTHEEEGDDLSEDGEEESVNEECQEAS